MIKGCKQFFNGKQYMVSMHFLIQNSLVFSRNLTVPEIIKKTQKNSFTKNLIFNKVFEKFQKSL